MNQLECPYCNSILNNVERISTHGRGMINIKGDCPNCKHYPGLHYVRMYFFTDVLLRCTMELTMFGDEDRNNKIFMIESFPVINRTRIYLNKSFNPFGGEGPENILDLEGCSVIPRNAKEKLKLYLAIL